MIPSHTTLLPCDGPQRQAFQMRLPSSVFRVLAPSGPTGPPTGPPAGPPAVGAAEGLRVRLTVADGTYTLRIGDESFPLSAVPEPSRVDLFRGGVSSQSCETLAKLSQKLSISQIKLGPATSRLLSQLNQSNSQKTKATLLPSAKDPSRHAKLPKRSSKNPSPNPQSQPHTPSITPKSRTLPLTTAPSKSLYSISNRVIHLLALEPNNAQTVAQRTKGDIDEVLAILKDYGSLFKDDEDKYQALYKLSDNHYKDIRIWQWKFYDEKQRLKIISDARSAFDRLNIEENHPWRLMLLDPKVRRNATPQPQPQSVPGTPTFNIETTPLNNSISSLPLKPSSPRVGGAILKINSNNSKKRPSPTTNSITSTSSILNNISKSNSPRRKRPKILSSEFVQSGDDDDSPSHLNLHPNSNSTSIVSNVSKFKNTKPSPKIANDPSKKSRTVSDSSNSSNTSTTSRIRSPILSSNSSNTSPEYDTLNNTASYRSKISPQTLTPTVHSSQEMFRLAEKFRRTYSEYASLYFSLESPNKKVSKVKKLKDVEKLCNLHKDLESWKSKLWNYQKILDQKNNTNNNKNIRKDVNANVNRNILKKGKSKVST